MSVVTLKSRFPQIIASLKPRVEASLGEGAELIAERARVRVPVLTGRLQDSIHVEKVDDGYAVVADAEGDDGTPYAVYVEFGGHEGGHGIGPHAFMIPAKEDVEGQIHGLAQVAIRKL